MALFPQEALNDGVRKREVFGWAMYDFANSGYTTVVLTAVFNVYFVSVAAANAPWATLAWTLALGLSSLVVMVSMPALGAYADLRAAKKRLLVLTTVGCVAATSGAGLGRARRHRPRFLRDRAVEHFLRLRRVVDRGLLAGVGQTRGHGPGFRLGLELRLLRRHVVARSVTGLRAVGAGQRKAGFGIRACDDGDHSRRIWIGVTRHVCTATGACAASNGTHHHWRPARVAGPAASDAADGTPACRLLLVAGVWRRLPGGHLGGDCPGRRVRRAGAWIQADRHDDARVPGQHRGRPGRLWVRRLPGPPGAQAGAWRSRWWVGS